MGASQATTRAERIAGVGYDYASRATEAVGCNLCGGPGHPVEVARRDRYGYPARFVVCRRCGLGYLSPRLTAGEYASFYAGIYRRLVSAHHGRRIDAETVQVEQRGYGDQLARFLVPFVASATRTILDVGGSTGTVADAVARRLGGRVTVLDPSADELAVADAAGMETVAGLAEDFDAGGRTWDLVLLCQTIDHLLDVRTTLAALRRMTSDEGRAFVDVLDVDFVRRRAGSIEGAVKIDHPYYLTGATARAFFALSGYRVLGERLADDGHLGFVLAPGPPTDPGWPMLEAGADRLLARMWAGRADRTPSQAVAADLRC